MDIVGWQGKPSEEKRGWTQHVSAFFFFVSELLCTTEECHFFYTYTLYNSGGLNYPLRRCGKYDGEIEMCYVEMKPREQRAS